MKSRRLRASFVLGSYLLAAVCASYSWSASMTVEEAASFLRENSLAQAKAENPATPLDVPLNGMSSTTMDAKFQTAAIRELQSQGVESKVIIQALVANFSSFSGVTGRAGDLANLSDSMNRFLAPTLTGSGLIQSGTAAHGDPSLNAVLANALATYVPNLSPQYAAIISSDVMNLQTGMQNDRVMINLVVNTKGEVVVDKANPVLRMGGGDPSVNAAAPATAGPPALQIPDGKTIGQMVTELVNNNATQGSIAALVSATNPNMNEVVNAMISAGVPPSAVVAELSMQAPPGVISSDLGRFSVDGVSAPTASRIQAVIDAVVSAAPTYSYASAVATATGAGADPSAFTLPSAAGPTTTQNNIQPSQSQPIQNSPIGGNTFGSPGTGVSQTPSSAGAGTGVSRS